MLFCDKKNITKNKYVNKYKKVKMLDRERPSFFPHYGPHETTTATATATSKNNRFSKQNNNSARASRFFVHFFAVSAQLRREMTKFQVFLEEENGKAIKSTISV